MKLTKIHRVSKFTQSDWMKKYIDFNTEKRTNPVNSFERYFFKLMINSVQAKQWKTYEKESMLVQKTRKKVFLKYISRPTLITHKIFGKNYAAIHEIKPVLTLKKPIYVEFTVLELNKWLMYDFHYSFIKKHFDAELMFTDTDSFTCEIKQKDVYEDFFNHKHLLDFSNCPKGLKLFVQADKKNYW